jgi:integrase
MKRPLSVSSAIEYYVRARRQLGFQMEQEARVLATLAAYARQTRHRGPLTSELVVRWAQLPQGAERVWWASRLGVARRFAQYWLAFDPRTQIPPAGFFGPAHRRPPVHIYTPDEIVALLAATTSLGPPGSLRVATFRTLFALLACTGLRISEALRLRPQDLDPIHHTLLIQAAKFSPSRRLPVHASASQALLRYDRLCQEKLVVTALRPALFLNTRGAPLSRDCAETTFRQLREQLGWRQPPIARLHDLRHTFAVTCLLRWNRRPGAITSNILALSAYLGHRQVSDTYWYLTAIPQLLARSSARFEQLTRPTSKLPCHE